MEYQQRKKQQKKRIEKQEELIKEIKKKHKLTNEEVVRKEIPGLETKQMTWMRDLIYKHGTTA